MANIVEWPGGDAADRIVPELSEDLDVLTVSLPVSLGEDFDFSGFEDLAGRLADAQGSDDMEQEQEEEIEYLFGLVGGILEYNKQAGSIQDADSSWGAVGAMTELIEPIRASAQGLVEHGLADTELVDQLGELASWWKVPAPQYQMMLRLICDGRAITTKGVVVSEGPDPLLKFRYAMNSIGILDKVITEEFENFFESVTRKSSDLQQWQDLGSADDFTYYSVDSGVGTFTQTMKWNLSSHAEMIGDLQVVGADVLRNLNCRSGVPGQCFFVQCHPNVMALSSDRSFSDYDEETRAMLLLLLHDSWTPNYDFDFDFDEGIVEHAGKIKRVYKFGRRQDYFTCEDPTNHGTDQVMLEKLITALFGDRNLYYLDP